MECHIEILTPRWKMKNQNVKDKTRITSENNKFYSKKKKSQNQSTCSHQEIFKNQLLKNGNH